MPTAERLARMIRFHRENQMAKIAETVAKMDPDAPGVRSLSNLIGSMIEDADSMLKSLEPKPEPRTICMICECDLPEGGLLCPPCSMVENPNRRR